MGPSRRCANSSLFPCCIAVTRGCESRGMLVGCRQDPALKHSWLSQMFWLKRQGVSELNGAAFANPPYSSAKQHEGEYITGMRHTHGMRELGGRYVFLIKSATSEVWWPENADHVAFIRGRIGFDVPSLYRPADARQEATSASFGAAIAIFDKAWRGPVHSYVSRDQLMAHGGMFLAQIRREAERLAEGSVA